MLVVGWLNWYSDGTFQSSYRETLIGSSIAVPNNTTNIFQGIPCAGWQNYCNYIRKFCLTDSWKSKHKKEYPRLTDYLSPAKIAFLFNFNAQSPRIVWTNYSFGLHIFHTNEYIRGYSFELHFPGRGWISTV